MQLNIKEGNVAKDLTTKSTQEIIVSQYKALSVPAQQLTTFLIENIGSQGLRPADLDKIKVPAGGGAVWEVPTLKGPEPVKVLEGIVLHFKDVRGYWSSKESGNNPPDCSSNDGMVGIGKPGGDCQKCPLAQFGSAIDDKGQPSKGQACKSMRMLLFLRQEDMLPMIISLPPTSLQNAKKYFLRLVANGLPYYGVTSQLRLEQEKSGAGKVYSKVSLAMGRQLETDELEKVQMIGKAMRELFARTVVDATDVRHE